MVDKLDRERVTIGDTQFKIGKLNAMSGASWFWRIKREVGRNTKAISVLQSAERDAKGNLRWDEATIAAMVDMVLAVDPEFLDELSAAMFKRVEFQNSQVQKFMSLGGAEPMAFGDAADVIELTVRCLYLNFSGTASRIVSLVPNDLMTGLPDPIT